MFKIGQRVTTTRDVIGGASSNRILFKGATGVVDALFDSLVQVKIDGDRGFNTQNGCWRFSRQELSVVQNISVNKDAIHLLSKE